MKVGRLRVGSSPPTRLAGSWIPEDTEEIGRPDRGFGAALDPTAELVADGVTAFAADETVRPAAPGEIATTGRLVREPVLELGTAGSSGVPLLHLCADLRLLHKHHQSYVLPMDTGEEPAPGRHPEDAPSPAADPRGPPAVRAGHRCGTPDRLHGYRAREARPQAGRARVLTGPLIATATRSRNGRQARPRPWSIGPCRAPSRADDAWRRYRRAQGGE